ncbi:regulatory protein, tetR family [Raineyella antarctica]|uniref:Regulatory protein, tetR family n=1 Tax=Raineyella antarctica TaxID=1577474 RepID=A0A1G6H867_9ACTN|nr:TetR family transcriptional regulator [Raineyella antarctica]SDB90452.1 regulatory protein, tetR family [Raineyella antarctica]
MPNLPIARRRELLLDAGVRVIARSGVAAATTRAIVNEAGMPLASFHYAFTNHEEFLLRLIERQLVPAPSPEPTADTFPEALEQFLGELLVQDAATQGVVAELAIYGVLRDGLREETSQRLADYDRQLADGLQRLADDFGMEWTIAPERLAKQVNAWRFGAVVQSAYARRGASYVHESGAKECAILLGGTARPARAAS